MMRPRSIGQFSTQPDVTGFVTIRIDEELKGLVAGRFNNSDHAQQMFVGVRAAAENVVAAIDAGQANN